MDAITLLKTDHKTVEKLFKRFEKAGPKAHTTKRQVVDQIIEELSRHAAIEEQLFYPVTRATVPAVEDDVLESLEEHHIVKWVLSELQNMDPTDERFDAKVTVLIENVRHHVSEEEDDYFPKVRDELGTAALGELGNALEAAKSIAPTKPHPRSPDEPPGNVVAGAAAAVVDRVTDTVSGVAQGGVAALQDVIAAVRGTKSPAAAATGSRQARRTAAKVRAVADKATDEAPRKAAAGAKKASRKAASGTKKAAHKAQTGAKRTTRKASKSAKRTTRKATSSTTSSARKATTSAKRTGRKAAAGTKKAARKATSGRR